MKLPRELWLRLEPLLGSALEMDPASRAGWLEGIGASHPELAPILRRMLATHDRAERRGEMEAVPRFDHAPLSSGGHAPGERIGPFRLLSELGRGGMGEVWLAEQADGRVAREVALKLPAPHLLGGAPAERFRRERDILAKLAHPNIARLYDAGVGDSGQPYLAMEYVEGDNLTDHASARSSGIRERLQLFRQVLAATAHAHRHLVVHRDLKPANILIDRSGQVKLLDFGIAKLVDDVDADGAARDLTRLGGRVMTLRYAAPEQAAGGAITTATDIYSLGVILHELLTGASPYRAAREGRALTEAMLLQDEDVAPSALAPPSLSRQVRGDLDAIVRKAMRRDPAERYASVELLDEDIARHLERRPVKARAGTWRYLAGRFVARHKLPIATAAAVLVTLAAGLVMVELERRVAVAERERAQRHFASVRKLANTLIFDVHGEIETLPGTLKVREMLVKTSIEYLDALAGEAGKDTALALEVASAYRRLAEIQGDSRYAHLGEPESARRSAARASAILEEARSREPDNLGILREQRVLSLLRGRMILEAGDAAGVDETARAADIAERIASLAGADTADRLNLGATLAEYGGILAVVKDDHAAAGAQLSRAIGTLEGLLRDDPANLPARSRLAYAYERAAAVAEATGDPTQLPRAILLMERSIATTESVIRDDPAPATHSQTLVKRYNNAARVRLKAHDVKGAREKSAKARNLVEQLLAADARNVGNATMLAGVLAMASDVEHQAGRHERAIALARAALAADARLPAEIRAGLIVRENAAGAMTSLAASSCALAAGAPAARRAVLLEESRKLFRESRAFKQELVSRGIDAREAARAIVAIDDLAGRCAALGAGEISR
ncbi:MAG: serine/threonine-protein kinase [Burkholderiales bacterium]